MDLEIAGKSEWGNFLVHGYSGFHSIFIIQLFNSSVASKV